ncbi:DUF1697 domain-containing protein [Chitinophaga sp. MM2321]|uniref:DUF1697 domain-containing protein n=1 Tax=Chitinophaga sp. MM2321 TaxID=3137178 RepID=UPI0032D58DE2
MTRYVAFLRAINVGGNRMVKMEVLRELFAKAGFKNITTYIQSGNVIFESASTDTAAIEAKIEKQMLKALGFEIPACVRSFKEMDAILKNNPFPGIVPDKEIQIYVAFLQTVPGANAQEILTSLQSAAETYHINGREVYILSRKTLMKTPFSNNYLEKKLGVVSTTRNLATVGKVLL